MRDITEKAIKAFNEDRPFRLSNTKVVCENNETSLYLFNRKIAAKIDGDTYISGGDYRVSRTTQDRLNAISGVHLRIKKGVYFLNKYVWDGKWVNTNIL